MLIYYQYCYLICRPDSVTHIVLLEILDASGSYQPGPTQLASVALLVSDTSTYIQLIIYIFLNYH